LNKDTQQKYDQFAKQKVLQKIENLTQKFLGINKWRKEIIKSANGKILEIGIGTGTNFKYYSKNCQVFATDISLEMLRIAQKAKPVNLKVNFLLADVENLPFAVNSFDNVVSTFSLCTIDKPVKAIKEIKRVCKTTRELLFLEHGKSKYKIINQWQNIKTKKHFKQLNCHNNRNIIQIIKQGGIKKFNIQRKWFGIFYIIKLKKQEKKMKTKKIFPCAVGTCPSATIIDNKIVVVGKKIQPPEGVTVSDNEAVVEVPLKIIQKALK